MESCRLETPKTAYKSGSKHAERRLNKAGLVPWNNESASITELYLDSFGGASAAWKQVDLLR